MKKILLFAAILFSLDAVSQEPYYDFKKFRDNKKDSNVLLSEENKSTPFDKMMERLHYKKISPGAKGSIFTHPGSNRIQVLPQDNMPCLVPDLSKTNYNMPNAGKGIRITGMPPGSAPPNKVLPR